MNCKELRKYITDYMGGTLVRDLSDAVEEHLGACAECAGLVRELEDTSSLVRSLDRVAVPAGFDRRLRERLDAGRARASDRGVLGRIVRALREAYTGSPAHRPILRPAVAGILLCMLVGGSLFMLFGNNNVAQATDQAFIETCQEQHTSFAAANPLADESAVLLKDRARDLGGEL